MNTSTTIKYHYNNKEVQHKVEGKPVVSNGK